MSVSEKVKAAVGGLTLRRRQPPEVSASTDDRAPLAASNSNFVARPTHLTTQLLGPFLGNKGKANLANVSRAHQQVMLLDQKFVYQAQEDAEAELANRLRELESLNREMPSENHGFAKSIKRAIAGKGSSHADIEARTQESSTLRRQLNAMRKKHVAARMAMVAQRHAVVPVPHYETLALIHRWLLNGVPPAELHRHESELLDVMAQVAGHGENSEDLLEFHNEVSFRGSATKQSQALSRLHSRILELALQDLNKSPELVRPAVPLNCKFKFERHQFEFMQQSHQDSGNGSWLEPTQTASAIRGDVAQHSFTFVEASGKQVWYVHTVDPDGPPPIDHDAPD